MKKLSSKTACPCNSQRKYKDCCEPFLLENAFPTSPEQLMRSRYTAFFLNNFNYIKKTMKGKALENFDMHEAISQSKKTKWLSLKVLNSFIEENQMTGFVEFIAEYSSYGKIYNLHEKSMFYFDDKRWYYTDSV